MSRRATPTRPTIPDDETVRRCLRLILEEAAETIEASVGEGDDGYGGSIKQHIDSTLKELRRLLTLAWSVKVSLPEFADGLVDLAYVTEDAAQEFGLDTEKLLGAVHAANMAKSVPCGCDHRYACGKCDSFRRITLKRPDGKVIKPYGWTPPDIAAELERQGWQNPAKPQLTPEEEVIAAARSVYGKDGILNAETINKLSQAVQRLEKSK